jgi:preprotein translocase subunit SecA
LPSVRITGQGVDLKREGLLGPSSTWTYMINDNPMGDVFERLTRGIKRLVKRGS